jgi:uncharacterized membrane protein YqiK
MKYCSKQGEKIMILVIVIIVIIIIIIIIIVSRYCYKKAIQYI